MHLRSQDRPGAVRDVLDSLGTHLRREFRSLDKAKASDQISAWHALSQLTAGYAAFTRLAICVPFHNGDAGGWSDEEVQRYRQKLEQIEHDVRHDAARAAADARSPADPFREGPGTPEDPVVSISFTETPTEHAGLQRPCTCETAGID